MPSDALSGPRPAATRSRSILIRHEADRSGPSRGVPAGALGPDQAAGPRPEGEASRGLGYMRALDGLRGVAIAGVLVEHFLPVTGVTRFSPGGIGVTVFFVLSGYLITRILIGYRHQGVRPGPAAKHFYWRRLLRLSPPYYAAIAVAAVLGLQTMRSDWWIHVLYLTNVRLAFAGGWVGSGTHFWSLATEEQFYLVWFCVVLWLPRRALVPAVAVAAAITFVFRGSVYAMDLSPVTTVLLPGNLVSLAVGGWLATVEEDGASPWLARLLERRWFFLAATAGAVAVTATLPWLRWPNALFYPFLISAFGACLVWRAAHGAGATSRLLDWTPLVRLGRISYGVYVYHLFIYLVLEKLFPERIRDLAHGLPWFVLACVVSIAVAQLSFTVFERPFLDLKRLVKV